MTASPNPVATVVDSRYAIDIAQYNTIPDSRMTRRKLAVIGIQGQRSTPVTRNWPYPLELNRDRHHCFKSSNIAKTDGGQIHPNYDLHEIQLTQKEDVGKISYREHALAYPNYSFNTCGGPEVFTSNTIFEKCGGKISSGGQELYILKDHQELLYQVQVELLRLTSSHDHFNQCAYELRILCAILLLTLHLKF